MKKIISVLVFAAIVSVAAFAQKADKKDNGQSWREKVRAEQVAFITSDLGLTESEAQKFWPVYNDIQAKRRDAYKESFEAMRALEEGLEKDEDTGKLLDNYMAAKAKITDLENESVKKYSTVLPKKKVAKLMLSEERFRQSQIGKMRGGHGGPQFGGPQGGPNNKAFPGAPKGGKYPHRQQEQAE